MLRSRFLFMFLLVLLLTGCSGGTPTALPILSPTTTGITDMRSQVETPSPISGEEVDPRDQMEEGTLSNPDITATITLTSTTLTATRTARPLR